MPSRRCASDAYLKEIWRPTRRQREYIEVYRSIVREGGQPTLALIAERLGVRRQTVWQMEQLPAFRSSARSAQSRGATTGQLRLPMRQPPMVELHSRPRPLNAASPTLRWTYRSPPTPPLPRRSRMSSASADRLWRSSLSRRRSARGWTASCGDSQAASALLVGRSSRTWRCRAASNTSRRSDGDRSKQLGLFRALTPANSRFHLRRIEYRPPPGVKPLGPR
jgi:hypothetical protein